MLLWNRDVDGPGDLILGDAQLAILSKSHHDEPQGNEGRCRAFVVPPVAVVGEPVVLDDPGWLAIRPPAGVRKNATATDIDRGDVVTSLKKKSWEEVGEFEEQNELSPRWLP